ncbi:hypothetical protein [uncultured Aquimarina sp.]|uniref:hypothetical protein n=1 Tax=uncultured Aquimarina sp. TaxID=575652 RepID=UPI00260C7B01|nr:hypothetical protein [uncultured Aquimarina sp.]
MKNQIQTTETKNLILPIFILLGAVIIFTAPLLHIYFPKKQNNQIEFEAKINDFNEEKDLALCDLKRQFETDQISSYEYINLLEAFQIDKDVENDLLDYELDKIVDNNRVFGFRSLRVFLIGFGIRLPYILFSAIILFFVLYSREKLKKNIYLYNAVRFLYSIAFLISFYMTIWFLLPRDLPVTAYHILIGFLATLSSVCSIFLLKYYYSRKTDFHLSLKVRELVRFITQLRKTYVLDFAVKATQADPNLKNDIKVKLGEFEEELQETMMKVAKNEG